MSQKYYVCQGAECACKYGSTPDKLLVNTHTKHYINDKEMTGKLRATTLDIGTTFEKNTFGSCSRKNGNPCIANVIQWRDPSVKVYFEDIGGGYPLLEDSTADCPVGGSSCIKIIYHGQTAGVHSRHFEKSDESVLQQLMPLTDTNEITNDTEDWVE